MDWLRMHVKLAEQSGTPVTVHIGSYPPDPNGIVEFLEKGDVVTHVYNGKTATLFQPDGYTKGTSGSCSCKRSFI